MKLKTLQLITTLVIVLTVVLLLLYDTWVAITGGTNATISWVIWESAHKYPIIPFLVGGLCGHLFFSQVDANATHA